MAQFRIEPLDVTSQSSQWVVYWDGDRERAEISVELTGALGSGSLSPISSRAFALTASNDSFTLTMDACVWTFTGEPLRGHLIDDFVSFLDAIEAVEGSQLAVGAAAAVRATLASRLPSTLEETLYFRYGLYRAGGASPVSWVDMIPTQRLQIDTGISQFVPPASNPSAGVCGYVAGAGALAEVVSTPHGTVIANAFLAGNTVPAITPGTGGAGSVLDVQQAVEARHLRVCYPRTLDASSAPESVDVHDNVALIGADTLTALGSATDAFYKGAPLPSGTCAAFFRGRATITPVIEVAFDGVSNLVAIGTTTRNVIERVTALPRLASNPMETGVKVQRPLANVLYMGGWVALLYPVSMATCVNGSALDAWDLPLIGGDAIELPQSPSTREAD